MLMEQVEINRLRMPYKTFSVTGLWTSRKC